LRPEISGPVKTEAEEEYDSETEFIKILNKKLAT
jgi:hypothetical protein